MASRNPSPMLPAADDPRSLVAALRALARNRPDDCAFRFLDSGGNERGMLTFGGLDREVRAVAAGIQRETGGGSGARVLVLQPPGLEYVTTFLGCLYAGAIAVTSYPKLLTRQRERLTALVADAGPSIAVTSGEATAAAGRLTRDGLEFPGMSWLDAAALRGDADAWQPPTAASEEVAFLQYTSGTTASPRGVMVTHGNIMANSAALSGRLGYGPGSRMVSWLPPYHDMGLIGGILQPLYAGFECILMAPATFAADPFQWLRALSEYGGTTSFAPTFALDLCADRIPEEQLRTLDLHAWDSLVVGAETVRADAVERFRKTFGPCGAQPDLICGGYGLAESTLAITIAPPEAEPVLTDVSIAAMQARQLGKPEHGDDRRTLVGSGRNVDELRQRVRIVDPDTLAPCGPDEIGEIWANGPSVAAGYWQREEATAATFRARTTDGEGPFLRTGDLGFLQDGELFVCGRIKDLIIVNGRNLYPQDIEACAGARHPGIRRNLCAAASLPADEGNPERLLVVAEVERHLPEEELPAAAEAIRTAVAEEFEVRVHAVALIRAASMPRTSSGKLQRHACARGFLTGELSELYRWTDSTAYRAGPAAAESATTGAAGPAAGSAAGPADAPAVGSAGAGLPLRELVLGLDPALRGPVLESDLRRRLGTAAATVASTTPLVSMGVDSLRAFDLHHRIEREYAVRLPLTDVLETSLAELARGIIDGLTAPAGGDAPVESTGEAAAAVPAPTATPAPAPASAPAQVPASDDPHAPFPLTDLQHAYFVGRSASYRLGGVSTHFYAEFDAPADLDVPRLLAALDTVVRRHDMLRAVVTPDGEQRVLPAAETGPVPVARHDLTASPAESVEEHLADVRERLSHQVLPLGHWPLFALEVSELPRGCRLHFGLDLLIADVRSAQILFREWEACYRDPEAAGRLPELPVSFRDLVLAAQHDEDGPRRRRAQEYWQARIPALPPAPALPLLPAPGTGPHRFHRLSERLDEPVWRAVKELAAEHALTPSAVLLAAYACTLGAWSGTGRFTLHVTLFNRPPEPAGADAVIGDFTSVTLLEVDLTHEGGTAAFVDAARRIQRRMWEDLDHREYSAVQVLRDLRRMRGDEADLFAAPVVFTSGRGHGGPGEDADDLPTGWLGETAFAVSQTPQVVLDHQIFERAGALLLNWDVVREMFPENVAEDMFRCYAALLGSLAEPAAWRRPARPAVAGHTALTERANDTAGPLPEGPLHGPLLEQAGRRPDAVAVVAGDTRLSYGLLLGHAHRLAQELREKGVEPNRLVGVSMEKSAEQIVAVLAVLLAGGAYLPVDPALPAERQDFLAEHGGLELVLTRPGEQRDWPAGVRQVTVALDGPPPGPAVGDGREGPDDWEGDPADLAYVIFTSGSTGVPKGVMVSHRAALNTCADINERFGVSTDDTVLGLSSLSFDLSVWDVFGVLGAGGTLVLPEPDARRDPARWQQLIETHDVTLWNSVPALMQMYAEHLEGARHEGPLRLAMLSGDWIPLDLPGRLHRLVPGIEVVSLGGATEAAIWSVCHPVTPAGQADPATPEASANPVSGPAWDSVPYGTALRNQSIRILDDRMLPCPPWVTGEIHLGGAGLADGYWRDPERTAAAFITDPHSGGRLYRTGDLGRWRPEGVVEFLGRQDGQVKVGGYRIELGEVEALLGRHEDVETAVAAAPGDRHRRTLVAAVRPTPAARSAYSSAELTERVRRYARQHLPPYMVPAALTTVGTLPLTANGKVDRAAIAELAANAAGAQGARGADGTGAHPATPAAATAAAAGGLAQRILRVAGEASGITVGPARSFFEQGIDSVTIVRIHRLLRAELDRPFPLTLLFENPSVNALAAALGTPHDSAPAPGDDPLERARAAARRKRRPRRDGRQQSAQPTEQEQSA